MKGEPVSKGFTLIELLVVLVIISLISAFVGPRIIAPFGNLHVKTATREIAGTLRYNRSRAVSEKVVRVAMFDLDTRSVRTFSVRNFIPNAIDEILGRTSADMTYELPNGVGFEEAESGDETVESGGFPIAFFPNGSSSGGKIVLSGASGRRFAVIADEFTGIVRVEEMESGK
jgi:general secretion pathway protein H